MTNPLKSFFNNLFWRSPELRAKEDPTVYRIETSKNKYEGTILYQDDMVIKFNCKRSSAVKILKANIQRVTVVQPETNQQFYHRLNLLTQPNSGALQPQRTL